MSDSFVPQSAVEPVPDSIDDRIFVMTYSSGSSVDDDAPTLFRYRQDGQMVWGEYFGDTVSLGRFVGRRDGNDLSIRFAHRPSSGEVVVLGEAHSTIQWNEDGKLELYETFDKEGVSHLSKCVEVDRRIAWPDLDPRLRSEPQLNGTTFVLEESTASRVSAVPTRFEFDENSGVVWGFYFGDTVTSGHCVGRYRDGVLDEYFVHHVIASDSTLLGDSRTKLGRRKDGQLELIEEFVLDGIPGRSVCVQVA